MITLDNLSKSFGAVPVLKTTSLTLPAGSVTVLQGPSGSGKTTLLRLIAGLEYPSSGEIHLGGTLAGTPTWLQPPHDRNVGFVFQNPALWPHLTVAQNVAFGLLGLPKNEISHRVHSILAMMELDGLERRYPSQLSGGQARRTAIARTLITRPQRLLMDEPLTHLQDVLKRHLIDLILDFVHESASTLLYVTHDPDETHRIGGTLLTLIDGQLTTTTPENPRG